MIEPIAILPIDTRSWGPAYCEACEEELEDVLLSTEGKFVCPECGADVPGFEDAAKLFCSARLLTAQETVEFKNKEAAHGQRNISE